MIFQTPDGQTWSLPRGCTPAMAKAIADRTATSTYTDGDTEFLIVTTILEPDPLHPQDECDDGFFYDSNWIDWVVATHDDGWSWIDGSGADGAGEWFAQQQDIGDRRLWVAIAQRPRRDDR